LEKITIQVEVDVNPTESEEKVNKALWNLFGDMKTETKTAQKGIILLAETQSQEPLITLRNVLHRDHIRDAARKALHQGLRGNSLTFFLNKQVAYANHVSFCQPEGESPLGPIKVTIQTDDPLQLVDWIAPKTIKP
jgi:predicted RNA binding protein with dsRBD fold (UPF0201 family)